jgi:hypothetical protein
VAGKEFSGLQKMKGGGVAGCFNSCDGPGLPSSWHYLWGTTVKDVLF